jgi:hypothetical protein
MTRMARFLATLVILAMSLGLTASVAAAAPGSQAYATGGATLLNEDCNFPKGDKTSVPTKPRLLSATIGADGTSASFINYSAGCTYKVGLASYQIFGLHADGTPEVSSQEIFDFVTATLGPGQSVTLNVTLPSCMAQVDAIYGDIITTFAFGDRYGSRVLGAKTVGTTLCTHDSGNCTYTPGYWKNHAEVWPVTSLKLGTVTYTKAQLLQVLSQPTSGNGLTNLTRQLIAAKLNMANGSNGSAISTAIAQADSLIGNKVAPPIGTGSLKTSQTAGLVATLDAYNNGVTGPGHCG